MQLPPLKRPPVYGVFRWWPQEGESWIHPFDIGIVRQLVPGSRVFRREDLDEQWLSVTYGKVRFRIQSTIWYEVDYEGFDVGDFVEIKSRMGQADPCVGRIRDMFWNHQARLIEYYLDRTDVAQVRPCLAGDMTAIEPVDPAQRFTGESTLRDSDWFQRELPRPEGPDEFGSFDKRRSR